MPLAGFGRRLDPRVGGYTLLSLELETGRRNQIRAHLAWAGHPVAGDAKYGARSDPLRRLCLHAESLAFWHPADGRLMRFEVPALPALRGQLAGQRLYLRQNRDADKGLTETLIRVEQRLGTKTTGKPVHFPFRYPPFMQDCLKPKA